MALTLSNGSITQLTASGTSTAMNIADGYAADFSIKHVNGTGTITAGALIVVEKSYDGTNFVPDTSFRMSKVASETEYKPYTPPADGLPIHSIRLVYTAPDGSSGHTLDATFGKTTAL